MTKSNELQPAYVLHSRAYRETSTLTDFFTLQYGRISAVVRGIRTAKSPLKGLLQPFTPLLISWIGKNDLVTLKHAESSGTYHALEGKDCLSGLYLNELLTRLLHRHYALPGLFHAYQTTLSKLALPEDPEPALRFFEMQLLKELGYGLELNRTTLTGESIVSEKYYAFRSMTGLSEVMHEKEDERILGIDLSTSSNGVRNREMHIGKDPGYAKSPNNIFQGKHLLALHAGDLNDMGILRDAKKLLRLALKPLLGNKPIMSRKLFHTGSRTMIMPPPKQASPW